MAASVVEESLASSVTAAASVALVVSAGEPMALVEAAMVLVSLPGELMAPEESVVVVTVGGAAELPQGPAPKHSSLR